jgi:hypothetical protein
MPAPAGLEYEARNNRRYPLVGLALVSYDGDSATRPSVEPLYLDPNGSIYVGRTQHGEGEIVPMVAPSFAEREAASLED